MTAEDFERRYRANPDPWAYEQSDYEREKYAATLRACGDGPFANALELGGSIGVFSALLARRCRALTTIDLAPTAVRIATQRLADQPHVQLVLGRIPDDIPPATHDLVVASEILYYLEASQLALTLDTLRQRMATGSRLVAVHWRPPGPERPFTTAAVHARLREQPWLTTTRSESTADYLLDVLEPC